MKRYLYPEIVALGEQLLEVLEDDEALDIALVNRCAEVLGIRAWFTWLDFEDMPESYYRV